MEKITIAEARQILKCLLVADDRCFAELMQKSDDELLKANVCKEFNLNLGSLDFAAMEIELLRLYGIKLVDAGYSRFFDEPTVKNFVEMVNSYGIHFEAYRAKK